MEFGSLNSDGYTTNGSGQLRSDPFLEEGNRGSKMGKRVEHDLGVRSESKQQMLSFSSSDKGEEEVVGVFADDGDLRLVSERNGLSFFNQNHDSGNRCGIGLGNGGMHGSLTGIRGPFTPAQWIELEHQAMIYKYFTANVPVPSNLLIPIKKAIQSAVFPGLSFGSYPSHSYGWGSFHLGFSNSTDPEPGRCRRTDGKKWRCSRDAVPEQKYCERHINRGRHRSRKPVEGHTGQAASGVSTTKAVSSVTPCGGVSSGTATVQHQIKGLQSAGVAHTSTEPIAERLNDQQGLSVRTTTVNVDSKDSQYDGSSVSEFGIVSNDALLNPSQKRTYLDGKNYNSLLDFNTVQNQEDQNSLRYFTDNWPKDQSHGSAIPWPKDLKADWTQLSMSIPVSKDYSLSSSSTNHEKVELDTPQMCLGIGTTVVEGETKRNAWIPIPGGNSTGGPLGEVLLNNTSPEHESLQKTTFVSLSKSMSGGSPKGEKKMVEGGASLCDDLLGLATRATCASIPSM